MKRIPIQNMIRVTVSFLLVAALFFSLPPLFASASTCPYCSGRGECESCLGTGDCSNCFGTPEQYCRKCSFGDCVKCGGEGVIKSYAAGKIQEKRCSYCSNGNCRDCDGTGRVHCGYCRDGECSTCGGTKVCQYCAKGSVSAPAVNTPVADNRKNTAGQQKANDESVKYEVKEDPTATEHTLTATIKGKKETFYLNDVGIYGAQISATYIAYNPRGEARYYIYIKFNKNLTEGTYNTTESILNSEVNITFSEADADESYNSYRRFGNKRKSTGSFTIEHVSDDWNAYAGSFDVKFVLYGKKTSIEINDAEFSFALSDTAGENLINAAPEDSRNTLTATIDGETVTFYLDRAEIAVNNNIIVRYCAYNPRGEFRYSVKFEFGKNYTEGSYQILERTSLGSGDVEVLFTPASENETYMSDVSSGNNKKIVGEFDILEMSDDWNTYTGSFHVTLTGYENPKAHITILDARFNFTLGETYDLGF